MRTQSIFKMLWRAGLLAGVLAGITSCGSLSRQHAKTSLGEGAFAGTISEVGPVQINLLVDDEVKNRRSVSGSCFLGGVGASTRVSGEQGSDGSLHLDALASTTSKSDEEIKLGTLDGRVDPRTFVFRGIWTPVGQTNGVAFELPRVAEFRQLHDVRQGAGKGTYTARYPQFEGDSPFHRAVNARLRETCQKECADYLSEFPSSDAWPDCEGGQDMQIVHCNKEVVSLLACWQEVFPHAAHGQTGSFGLNFVARGGQAQQFGLQDLFQENSGWEKKLSDFCIADLRKQGASSVVAGEIKELSPNKLSFAVSHVGLHIYFSPYDVASNVEGFFEVDVPWPAMRDYLRQNELTRQIGLE